MKIMFLDESGDHSLDKVDDTYPVFVLAGCIFDFEYYSKTVEPAVFGVWAEGVPIKEKRAQESPSPAIEI
jgi:hypothetical protein